MQTFEGKVCIYYANIQRKEKGDFVSPCKCVY